ncbi:hypothetical protein ACG83_10550 [Frankia sp. R43]|uniref:hypothetical protein n=1 Tax=Frankia sp. R43 TaxID=269536 RepID=UPI0006CA4A88|nr:hypothetical protein [Frankia sp. R43]KPM55714.1 hypothetical protein ACG83_10550 [Frankia sp. R43]
MNLLARIQKVLDPRCDHIDCGEPLRGDRLTLPVRLSDRAADVLGRRHVEFHADCANSSHLLAGGDESWQVDQDAVNRALGLVPPVGPS